MTDLDRFVKAQAGRHGTTFDQALAELQAGRKASHWIWFVLPQLRVLGRSQMARAYGIADLAEAQAYAAHPVLGPRLVACVRAMLSHSGKSAEAILGPVDALKFCSCLTLFEKAAPDEPVWGQALECFYGGTRDEATLAALDRQDAAPD
jgi:uncharacterized protein (DUF1810 family)